jgi:hypothetical protein
MMGSLTTHLALQLHDDRLRKLDPRRPTAGPRPRTTR